MSGHTSREGKGCPTPNVTPTEVPASDCGHDCSACATDFEQTQLRVEHLWAALQQEQLDHQKLWLEARSALRETLYDLIPAARTPGIPGDEPGFSEGWDRCRAEIEHRVKALAGVI